MLYVLHAVAARHVVQRDELPYTDNPIRATSEIEPTPFISVRE